MNLKKTKQTQTETNKQKTKMKETKNLSQLSGQQLERIG